MIVVFFRFHDLVREDWRCGSVRAPRVIKFDVLFDVLIRTDKLPRLDVGPAMVLLTTGLLISLGRLLSRTFPALVMFLIFVSSTP